MDVEGGENSDEATFSAKILNINEILFHFMIRI